MLPTTPTLEAGDFGVDAVQDDVDNVNTVDGAVLGEGLTRLGACLAEASTRVTPPLLAPEKPESAHQNQNQNQQDLQNPQNPQKLSLNYLDQPAPARAPLLAPAPDAIQNFTQQHQRNPAQALASCQEPVAAAAAASEGPPSGPPPGQPPGPQSPTAPPPLLMSLETDKLPIINRLTSPALSSSPPSLSTPYLPPTLHRSLGAASSTLPSSSSPPLSSSSQPPISSCPPPYHFGNPAELDSMPKMVFSDLIKSPKSPFAKFRQLHTGSQQHNAAQADGQQSSELLDYGDPDLLSRDKTKQKEAVRRYLAEKIRNDWDFSWPSPDLSSVVTDAAQARALAVRKRLVRDEQVGLLEPSETFASPLSRVGDCTTVSLAAVSAAVAADAATEAAAGDEPSFDDDYESDAESVYSTVSEDAIHFRPRAEWTSDLSEDEKPGTYYPRMPTYVHSPFRFDSPDAVGTSVNVPDDARKAKARRDMRAEVVWNEGLACFISRRDAWTGARTVHLKPAKPIAPTSPVSPRRGLFRFHSHTKSEPAPAVSIPIAVATGGKGGAHDSHSASTTPTAPAHTSPTGRTSTTMPLSPVTSNSRHSQHSQQSHHSHQSQQSAGLDTVATTPMTSDCGGGGGVDGGMLQQSVSHASAKTPQLGLARRASHASQPHPDYAVETIIPVAPPLLPPGNPMRASITPAIYLSLYDKLVSSSLQPSCPINLSDMIRSCVSGWKRDNEWPPRTAEMSAPAVAAMSVALRKKRRDERREVQKDKRDTTNHAADGGSSGLPSPGIGRRMSSFLGARPSPGNIVLPTTTAVVAGAGPTSPPIDEKDEDGINGQRGIRHSLQRVLGLGYAAHGGTPGGHGHSMSVGTVGQYTKQI